MKIKSKVCIIDITPGTAFVERNHSRGPIFYLETISDVETSEIEAEGQMYMQYKWIARNTETGQIIRYCISDYIPHYGPTLFQTYEESQAYWDYWNKPKQ